MDETFIIAIDFGTAFSGYAYSIAAKEKEIDPVLKKWGKGLGLDTPKAPTCILFDEHEEFMYFGYEAKTEYIDVRGEEAKKLYFFENFKMALYGTVSKYCWNLKCFYSSDRSWHVLSYRLSEGKVMDSCFLFSVMVILKSNLALRPFSYRPMYICIESIWA